MFLLIFIPQTENFTFFSSLERFFLSSDLSLKYSAISLKLHFFRSLISSLSDVVIIYKNQYKFVFSSFHFFTSMVENLTSIWRRENEVDNFHT